MSISKTFRLPEPLALQLSEFAKITARNEKFYIVEALKHYFSDHADAQIAKDRFSDPRSKIISSQELRKQLSV